MTARIGRTRQEPLDPDEIFSALVTRLITTNGAERASRDREMKDGPVVRHIEQAESRHPILSSPDRRACGARTIEPRPHPRCARRWLPRVSKTLRHRTRGTMRARPARAPAADPRHRGRDRREHRAATREASAGRERRFCDGALVSVRFARADLLRCPEPVGGNAGARSSGPLRTACEKTPSMKMRPGLAVSSTDATYGCTITERPAATRCATCDLARVTSPEPYRDVFRGTGRHRRLDDHLAVRKRCRLRLRTRR